MAMPIKALRLPCSVSNAVFALGCKSLLFDAEANVMAQDDDDRGDEHGREQTQARSHGKDLGHGGRA